MSVTRVDLWTVEELSWDQIGRLLIGWTWDEGPLIRHEGPPPEEVQVKAPAENPTFQLKTHVEQLKNTCPQGLSSSAGDQEWDPGTTPEWPGQASNRRSGFMYNSQAHQAQKSKRM